MHTQTKGRFRTLLFHSTTDSNVLSLLERKTTKEPRGAGGKDAFVYGWKREEEEDMNKWIGGSRYGGWLNHGTAKAREGREKKTKGEGRAEGEREGRNRRIKASVEQMAGGGH